MSHEVDQLQSQVEVLKMKISELKDNKQQLELVIKSTGVGIWDWHVQTGKTIFNERWANIIGYTLEELSPLNIETWMKHAHPDDLEESGRLLEKHWAGETEYYIFESRMKHRDGHWIWVYDTGQVIEWEGNGAPKRMIGTHLDITEKKSFIAELDEANEQLKEMSYLDSLTKIPNRRAYEEKLASLVENARRFESPLSFLMIDVDNFKQYNDNYGHKKGDEVLFRLAQKIKEALPRKTDFVARYGGEEIIAILPNTDMAGGVVTAKKIIHSVIKENIEHLYSNVDDFVTVSIGISSTSKDFDTLLDNADKALYDAKKNGRNRYECFASQ
jgi:diguanylate cyclase (GGDEF)-like protein/PAS domain S-box-containing protein